MNTPILIVGAGPVGMTMASELARYGVPIRIVDKAATRTDKSKALVIWSRTLELLDRGPGGSAPFVKAGFRADAVNFIAGDKTIGRVEMGSINSPYPYGLMLPQSETERLLEERLATQGVTVERSVEVIGIAPRNDGTDATLRHADGREEKVSTPWLVGCDGAHSIVRHAVGASFAGETIDSDWVLADVHMTGYPFPDSEVSVYWHRDGVFVIFPISPGRYRVIADQPASGSENPPTPTLELTQALIDRRGPSGLHASDPIWLSGFRINDRKVSDYRYGHTFLAGDAAHIHSPAGGQGMNTGMQDAFNLAWKLALVLRGACAETLLDSYTPERSRVGDEVMKAAARLTAIGTLHNPVAQTVRNLVGHVVLGLAPVGHAVVNDMSEVTIGYPDTPLNGPARGGSGPKAGERMAPGAGQPAVGSGIAPRFALFAEPNAAVAELIAKFGGILDPDLRPLVAKNAIWLVRPDGYVACSTSDAQDIAKYLGNVVGHGHA
jgi:2-polyprenyl-6-methoxyphenol hydroxylase-like FAD-dependent oxidoreductase